MSQKFPVSFTTCMDKIHSVAKIHFSKVMYNCLKLTSMNLLFNLN